MTPERFKTIVSRWVNHGDCDATAIPELTTAVKELATAKKKTEAELDEMTRSLRLLCDHLKHRQSSSPYEAMTDETPLFGFLYGDLLAENETLKQELDDVKDGATARQRIRFCERIAKLEAVADACLKLLRCKGHGQSVVDAEDALKDAGYKIT